MDRYIAIDNVCAWPNLTKMPDGAIIASIFNQPCHGHWEGDLGYPATVPGNDDTLVTAWYCNGIAAHRRYHMGAAVWRLDDWRRTAKNGTVLSATDMPEGHAP